jgi:hypothetical protein
MDWLDENTGWVSVKCRTGSNFSVGMLFRTSDGGRTWERLSLPLGEAVHFVDRQTGWLAGGPAGDQLYRTQDGGVTWEKQPALGSLAGRQIASFYPPVFDTPEKGLIPVVTQSGEAFALEMLATGDGGQNWEPISSLPLGALIDRPPLGIPDAQDFMVVLPNSDRIVRMVDGKLETAANRDGMSADIVELKMRTSTSGWARWHTGSCTTQPLDGSSQISCSAATQLLQTRDGGITWQALALPGNAAGVVTQSARTTVSMFQETATAGEKTLLVEGQGFDACGMPTIPQLQTWWNYSPYRVVNLYIGGDALANGCTPITKTYVEQMRAQGWAFIPTWVGPQSKCFRPDITTLPRISDNLDTAFAQGSDEAFFASRRLAELGLTLALDDPWSGGSVAYYDLEAYGSDLTCRTEAKYFIDGWIKHLHDLGNMGGVYSSAGCSLCWEDYRNIPNVPDVIWPALWYHNIPNGNYDPDASVWDLNGYIPTYVWNDHQRIRQYEGDHYETWGGVTLRIDSDVLDGRVAVPYLGTPSAGFSAMQLMNAPVTARFIILNTAFMSTCAWDYGDGQTWNDPSGKSCVHMHTHTYANPGIYQVSLTVSTPWGTGDASSMPLVLLPTTTTTIIRTFPNPSRVGQAVTINYSVVVNDAGGGTPVGNVTISDGSQSCSGSVEAGSCTIAFTASGLKNLIANYPGDANYNGSVSAAISHAVDFHRLYIPMMKR